MANTIRHKRNSTPGATPGAATLVTGELAVNTADGKVFTKKENGTVVEIGGASAGVTSIAGTAGEVDVSGSTGAVTISLPNNINVRGITTSTSLTFDAGAEQAMDFKFDGSTPLLTIDGVSGLVQVRAGSAIGFYDADESAYIGFAAPATLSKSFLLTLPSTDGGEDEALVTDGSAVLAWKHVRTPDFLLFAQGIT